MSPTDGAQSAAMQFEAERPGDNVLHLEVSARGDAPLDGHASGWVGDVVVPVGPSRAPAEGPAVIHIQGSGNEVRLDPRSGRIDLQVHGSGNSVGPSRGQPDTHPELGYGGWVEVPLRPQLRIGVLQPQMVVDAASSMHGRLTVRPDPAHRAPGSLLLLGEEVEVGRSTRSLDLHSFLDDRFSPEEKSAALVAVSRLALRLDARRLSSTGLRIIVENQDGATIDGVKVPGGDHRLFRSPQSPIRIAIDSRGPLGRIALEFHPISACMNADGLDRSRLGPVAQSVDESRRAGVGGFIIDLRIGGQHHRCRWIIDGVSGPDAGFGAASDGTVVLAAGQGWWIAAQRPAGRDWEAWPLLPGQLRLSSGFGCRIGTGFEPDFGGG